ncbi:MAG: helix-turn-helix domain-containing protein [Acidimicrobiia bacterium]
MSDTPADTATPVGNFEPVTLSIDEAAEILRVNRKTVVAMIDRGELPSVRYARRRWIPVRAIRDLLMLDIPSRVVSANHD